MQLVRELPIEKYIERYIIEIILGQGILNLESYNYTQKRPQRSKSEK